MMRDGPRHLAPDGAGLAALAELAGAPLAAFGHEAGLVGPAVRIARQVLDPDVVEDVVAEGSGAVDAAGDGHEHIGGANDKGVREGDVVAVEGEYGGQPAIAERQPFERHVSALDNVEAVDAGVLHADGLNFGIGTGSEANDLRHVFERIEGLVSQPVRHADAGNARGLLVAASPLRLLEGRALDPGEPAAILEDAADDEARLRRSFEAIDLVGAAGAGDRGRVLLVPAIG